MEKIALPDISPYLVQNVLGDRLWPLNEHKNLHITNGWILIWAPKIIT